MASVTNRGVPLGRARKEQAVPNDGEWPQRLYLLAEAAALQARMDPKRARTMLHEAVARARTQTTDPCPPRLQGLVGESEEQEEEEEEEQGPFPDTSEWTPASFLQLLAECETGAARDILQRYAANEAYVAQAGGTDAAFERADELGTRGADDNAAAGAKFSLLRDTYDDDIFYSPDIEAFVKMTGMAVRVTPAGGWYGSRKYAGGPFAVHLEHDVGTMEWVGEVRAPPAR